MVNTITIGISVPPASVRQPALETKAPGTTPASNNPVSNKGKPDETANETFGSGVDEQTLDRIALRLVKRDPGLVIEKDDIVRRYIYRFLDSESGDLIRQFPAEKVLATMRALRLASESRITTESAAADLKA